MKVLLTGGFGYIGSHTAVVLSNAGIQIVILDNFCNSDPSTLDRLQKILCKPIISIVGDVLDTEFVKRILIQHEINAVIHFAGLKAVGESYKRPLDYYANNLQGAISLLAAMESANIKKLVFSSSATVYGNPNYLPVDEEHPLAATSPYGATKLYIEKILTDVAKSDPDWSIAALRYFNPVGAHGSGLIGENPKGTPTNLMPFLVEVADKSRACLNIFGDDYLTTDGTGVRDYIHIEDLAEGHLAALSFLDKNSKFHAFNLGTGVGFSVLEVIEEFKRVNNVSIPFKVQVRRPGDVGECFSSAKKAEMLLHWKAKRSLADMCVSAWNFRIKNS